VEKVVYWVCTSCSESSPHFTLYKKKYTPLKLPFAGAKQDGVGPFFSNLVDDMQAGVSWFKKNVLPPVQQNASKTQK